MPPLYPAQMHFSLELHEVIDAARYLNLPCEISRDGIVVQVATPQQAYELGQRHTVLKIAAKARKAKARKRR